MPKQQSIIGKRYGRLVALSISHKSHSGTYWNCLCDCGNTIKAIINHLNNGHIKSCGCLRKDASKKANTKHGMYKSPEYRTWVGMKTRCNDPKSQSFHNYGGRGISVCEKWNSFENFYADMGKKPFPKASIERVDNNKGYSPENCIWADRVTQNNNSRHNVNITIDGATKTTFEWCRHYNIAPGTYYSRLRSGWPRLMAMQEPVRKTRKHRK